MERISERELRVTRTFRAPARLVFDAWTKGELFARWWTPKSFGMTIVSCEMDARTGGGYRLLITPPGGVEPMAFFGRYIEVEPPSRVVWTNDEGGEGLGPVTTVTFEQTGGETRVVLTDLYPSKAALDEAMATGATGGFEETFDQLDRMLEERA